MQIVQNKKNVCVIGMGYVGLTLSIGLGMAGYRITGIENNPHTFDKLLSGKPDVYEPNLQDIYLSFLNNGTISVKNDLCGFEGAETYVITVGTPLSDNGHTTTDYIEKAAQAIKHSLKERDLVILRSTVRVGTTRNVIKPILDSIAKDYFLAMCPERTVEGHALEELQKLPQIVGGIDSESTNKAASFFRIMSPKIVEVSSPEVAELAKIVCNTQRDLRFAYANEIALMAENFNLDVHEVIYAANQDYPRSNVALPGLVGGPCLEKDTYILSESISSDQTTPQLMLAARKINESLVEHAVKHVSSFFVKVGDVKKIAIIGLAFKGQPPTGDIRGSLAIDLQLRLKKYFPDSEITGYDPVATAEEARKWGLSKSDTFEDAVRGANLVFIQSNHPNFHEKSFYETLAKHSPECLVYDFWRCLDGDAVQNGCLKVIGLGIPNKTA